MRGIDREVLARDAASRISSPACRESQEIWDELEKVHGSAKVQEIARKAAVPLLRICAGCPASGECRKWAQIDRYTGIAAGTAWVNGVERPTHWVRRQAPRRQAS